MPAPWDKLKAESDESYARFLMYRNLGPGRSIRRAYHQYLQRFDGFTGGTKRLHVPGSWTSEAADHGWVSRAQAWDVRNLTAYGAKVAVLHVLTVKRLAEKNRRALGRLEPGDDGYTDVLAGIRVVADFLTPDVVRGIAEQNQPAPEPRHAAAGEPD